MTSLDNDLVIPLPAARYAGVARLTGTMRTGLSGCIALLGMALASTAYADPPTAVSDSRTIPVNSSITLNLIANDFDVDGDPISVIGVSSSNNATITLNPDGSVFYSPNTDFQGTDTFTYTIQEDTEEALTAQGTVTINVVEGDFVEASQGDNNRNLAQAMNQVCAELREGSDGEMGAGRRYLLERCNGLDEMAVNNPDAVNNALNQIAPEESIALMRVLSESNRSQTAAVSQRIGQLQAGNNAFTFNGMASRYGQQTAGGAAGDGDPIWSAIGFFVSAQYEAAERDSSNYEAGYDSDGTTLTMGADYRVSENLVMGAAVGYTENELDYWYQGGSLESEITTFILFSSYSMNRLSLETQVGYASTSFDSIRHLEYGEGDGLVEDTMYGNTEGSQLLLNSQLQWEWSRNALSVFPFVRFDYLKNEVDGYGEVGTGGLPMIIGSQSTDQLTLGAGVQSTYVLNQRWGVLIPMAQLTFLSEVSSGFDPVTARFAYDPDPDNTFTLRNDGEDTAYSQIAIGSSAIFKRGVSGFFQYQQLVGYNNLSAYQVQAGLRYEF